ncbi:uncharacterized protein LOC132559098 [Ylistrum balloti]|uniref:uncharacterized protein LOC132559098 n=1 Tax=Ylistrum balloti TaxID=509963 RepID=UPI002905F2CD|nr:uncharacterized protein LOC132559098 [Ylistrum balloti]
MSNLPADALNSMATSSINAEKTADDAKDETEPVSDASASENIETDQGCSAITESKETKSEDKEKETENNHENQEGKTESDQKKDENLKQSSELTLTPEKTTEDENVNEELKEPGPCSSDVTKTEKDSNDQNSKQSMSAVINKGTSNEQIDTSKPQKDDVASPTQHDVTSVQKENTLEALSLETEEGTLQTKLEVTPQSEQEVTSQMETSKISSQKEGTEGEITENLTDVEEKTSSPQQLENIVTQEGTCKDKKRSSPIEEVNQVIESESETLCTEDKNKPTKEEVKNDKTSVMETDEETEKTLKKQSVNDEDDNACETQASEEDNILKDDVKTPKQSRMQRATSPKTLSDTTGQEQTMPDVQIEPLSLVTKPTNDISNLSTPDEKTVPAPSPEDECESGDRLLIEESKDDPELNISDTSILEDSVSTDCSNLSTPDRYSRGTGLYRSYKCKGCKYNTPIKTNLRRHASINIEYKPYLCNLCGGKFTDKSTLNFHNKKRHSGFENFEFTPEDEKDKALDKYLDMCIGLEGKVKSSEAALRNPSKYKDCTLVTFDMFKHFKSTSSKKFIEKKELDSSIKGTNESSESERQTGKRKKVIRIPETKEQVYVTYPDGSTVRAADDTFGNSPAEPRRRGPGRKKKSELESFPVGSNTEIAPQISTSSINVNPPLISQRSPTPLVALPHPGPVMSAQTATQTSSINLIQTFGGIAIPVPMQMPMQIPIQVPAQIRTQIPTQMSVHQHTMEQPKIESSITHSKPPVTEANPTRQLVENEDKKKKGRTKTIREILNLDNGVRRQKLSHGQIAEAKANKAGSMNFSFGFKAGRGRGRRRGTSKSFDVETDQSSTDNSVPESELSGSEGDPSWPVPVQKRRGRAIARGRGIAPLKRKYMRMKLVGTSSEQYVTKSRRGSEISDDTPKEDKLLGIKKKKIESDLKEEENVSSERDGSSERKKVGRKRKIDCVTDPATGGLEKQRKVASETGILTEETINNSLLALKRRQDNITASGTRVKRKYVKRTKSLTMPPKKNKSRSMSNNSSLLLSTSSTSSTMDEQRDLNETGLSSTQSPEKRKRGRPASVKKNSIDLVKGPYKKNLNLLSKGTVSEQRTAIHSGCDKSPVEEGSLDGKKKRMNASPGRANCLCATEDDNGENVENSSNSVKKPTLLKSARMTNYVKKYSQKYSKLAKAKSQGKVMGNAKDPQLIKCPLCEYKSKSINGVRLHAFWVHKMCKYTCTECPYFTLNRFEGLAHYKEDHPGKTVSLVRSFCLLKDLEEDTTPGIEGKVMTLSLQGQTSPSKQRAPGKADIYDYSVSSESSPSKSPGAPDITSTVTTPVAEDRAKVLKGRCPKCSYVSTVRGVGQHLMLAHDTVNWVCKECKYKSHSKTLTVQHFRRNHKGMQPKVYRTAVLVKPDPDLNLELSSPKGSSTPKSSKGSTETDSVLSDLSPTMPKLKKFPKTWKMKLGSIKDRENLQQLIAKRKGKTGKVKVSETVLPESSTSYTLHPRKMEALKVGFSCVYCFYAAPLRHQLHLHCYDKHTNHPACLMKFTKDTVFDFLGDSAHVKITDKGKHLKSDPDVCKKETVSDKECVQRIIKWNNDQATESKGGVGVKGEVTERGDNSFDTKNKNQELPIKEKGMKECGVVKDIKSLKPHKVTLSHSSTSSEGLEEDATKTTVCPPAVRQMAPNKLGIGKPFSNPLTPLVTSLGAGQVRLHDTFHSSLDDLDTILSNFGVRTLNMDMLTRKQFTEFIHRFGNSLQQM